MRGETLSLWERLTWARAPWRLRLGERTIWLGSTGAGEVGGGRRGKGGGGGDWFIGSLDLGEGAVIDTRSISLSLSSGAALRRGAGPEVALGSPRRRSIRVLYPALLQPTLVRGWPTPAP